MSNIDLRNKKRILNDINGKSITNIDNIINFNNNENNNQNNPITNVNLDNIDFNFLDNINDIHVDLKNKDQCIVIDKTNINENITNNDYDFLVSTFDYYISKPKNKKYYKRSKNSYLLNKLISKQIDLYSFDFNVYSKEVDNYNLIFKYRLLPYSQSKDFFERIEFSKMNNSYLFENYFYELGPIKIDYIENLRNPLFFPVNSQQKVELYKDRYLYDFIQLLDLYHLYNNKYINTINILEIDSFNRSVKIKLLYNVFWIKNTKQDVYILNNLTKKLQCKFSNINEITNGEIYNLTGNNVFIIKDIWVNGHNYSISNDIVDIDRDLVYSDIINVDYEEIRFINTNVMDLNCNVSNIQVEIFKNDKHVFTLKDELNIKYQAISSDYNINTNFSYILDENYTIKIKDITTNNFIKNYVNKQTLSVSFTNNLDISYNTYSDYLIGLINKIPVYNANNDIITNANANITSLNELTKFNYIYDIISLDTYIGDVNINIDNLTIISRGFIRNKINSDYYIYDNIPKITETSNENKTLVYFNPLLINSLDINTSLTCKIMYKLTNINNENYFYTLINFSDIFTSLDEFNSYITEFLVTQTVVYTDKELLNTKKIYNIKNNFKFNFNESLLYIYHMNEIYYLDLLYTGDKLNINIKNIMNLYSIFKVYTNIENIENYNLIYSVDVRDKITDNNILYLNKNKIKLNLSENLLIDGNYYNCIFIDNVNYLKHLENVLLHNNTGFLALKLLNQRIIRFLYSQRYTGKWKINTILFDNTNFNNIYFNKINASLHDIYDDKKNFIMKANLTHINNNKILESINNVMYDAIPLFKTLQEFWDNSENLYEKIKDIDNQYSNITLKGYKYRRLIKNTDINNISYEINNIWVELSGNPIITGAITPSNFNMLNLNINGKKIKNNLIDNYKLKLYNLDSVIINNDSVDSFNIFKNSYNNRLVSIYFSNSEYSILANDISYNYLNIYDLNYIPSIIHHNIDETGSLHDFNLNNINNNFSYNGAIADNTTLFQIYNNNDIIIDNQNINYINKQQKITFNHNYDISFNGIRWSNRDYNTRFKYVHNSIVGSLSQDEYGNDIKKPRGELNNTIIYSDTYNPIYKNGDSFIKNSKIWLDVSFHILKSYTKDSIELFNRNNFELQCYYDIDCTQKVENKINSVDISLGNIIYYYNDFDKLKRPEHNYIFNKNDKINILLYYDNNLLNIWFKNILIVKNCFIKNGGLYLNPFYISKNLIDFNHPRYIIKTNDLKNDITDGDIKLTNDNLIIVKYKTDNYYIKNSINDSKNIYDYSIYDNNLDLSNNLTSYSYIGLKLDKPITNFVENEKVITYNYFFKNNINEDILINYNNWDYYNKTLLINDDTISIPVHFSFIN